MTSEQQNPTGLICAFLLDREGGGEQLAWQSIHSWTPEQGLLWLHLDYRCEDSQRWLATESGISPIMREALVAIDPRPRSLSTEDDELLLIIRGVNLNEGAEPEDMVSLRLWLDSHRIITLRHRRVNAVKAIRHELQEGKGPTSPGDFLVSVTNHMLQRIGTVTDRLDDAVAEMEDSVLAAESQQIRHELADLRRQAIALRRYVCPQRDVLNGLQSSSVPWLDIMHRTQLRENADRMTRIVEELDSARDRAAVTHEEVASRLSELLNERLYKLSIIAAVFLPLGFLTGLLGVNVGGIPGQTYPWGFAITCVALFGIGILQVWLFRKLRWF